MEDFPALIAERCHVKRFEWELCVAPCLRPIDSEVEDLTKVEIRHSQGPDIAILSVDLNSMKTRKADGLAILTEAYKTQMRWKIGRNRTLARERAT